MQERLRRFDRWMEKLYWKGFLLLNSGLVTAYIALTYLILGRPDFLVAALLTIGFPLSILAFQARRSYRAGKLLYLLGGASLAALGAFLTVFLVAVILRTTAGLTLPAPILVLAMAVGAIGGMLIGSRIGSRRGFLFPRL